MTGEISVITPPARAVRRAERRQDDHHGERVFHDAGLPCFYSINCFSFDRNARTRDTNENFFRISPDASVKRRSFFYEVPFQGSALGDFDQNFLDFLHGIPAGVAGIPVDPAQVSRNCGCTGLIKIKVRPEFVYGNPPFGVPGGLHKIFQKFRNLVMVIHGLWG